MGQMEARLDDGMGETTTPSRQIQLSPRTGEGEEL
jgi:hypothetical protein